MKEYESEEPEIEIINVTNKPVFEEVKENVQIQQSVLSDIEEEPKNK